MKKIYFSLLLTLGVFVGMAAPSIYTPELVAPANNQTGVPPNVTLDWTAVVGMPGLFYEIQLSSDGEFTAPENFNTELSRIDMSMLLFGETYFWRVRAKDESGTSEWSEVRDFTVLAQTTILTPANGATKVNANAEIKWNIITGIDYIDYQLDTVATFDSPEMRMTTIPGNLEKINTSNLKFGLTYYLRIRGRHAADTSSWSNVNSFTVTNIFELRDPTNNATNVVPDVEFRWKKVEGINKYNIYVALDPDIHSYDLFSAQKTDTKKKPDTLMFGTTYYWQMSAIHATDTLFSPIWSFSTIAAVKNIDPANNATNVPLQPILKWNSVSGVIGFTVQIASNPEFDNPRTYPIHELSNISTQSFRVPANIMDSATVYYWRTNMISNKDTSDWSPAWSFRTVSLGNSDVEYVRNVKIYPSPASTSINIQLPTGENGKAELMIFDLLGKARIVSEVNINRGLIRDIPVNNLGEGLYLVQVIKGGKLFSNRLIISR